MYLYKYISFFNMRYYMAYGSSKKQIEYNDIYFNLHKDKRREYDKKSYDKRVQRVAEKYRKHKAEFHNTNLIKAMARFYMNKYYRYFSSLENYVRILSCDDSDLKCSIMIKLGMGSISEKEALDLVGNIELTEKDKKYFHEKFEIWKLDYNNKYWYEFLNEANRSGITTKVYND